MSQMHSPDATPTEDTEYCLPPPPLPVSLGATTLIYDKTSDKNGLPTQETMTKLFPGYRFEPLASVGGFGGVFRACVTDAEMERQHGTKIVAFKVLKPHAHGVSAATWTKQFAEEAKALLDLNDLKSPHLVRFLDSGVRQEPSSRLVVRYILMNWVEGKSLKHHLTNPTAVVERGRVLSFFCDLALVLEKVHQDRCHRDITPANIMIEACEKGWRPVLVDFGISKQIGIVGHFTKIEAAPGTQPFSAPERPQPGHNEVAADIYALGMSLYFALLCRMPNNNENAGLLPSQMVLPEMPALQDFVRRACAYEPSERFRSMAEFHTALNRIRHPSTTRWMDRMAALRRWRSSIWQSVYVGSKGFAFRSITVALVIAASLMAFRGRTFAPVQDIENASSSHPYQDTLGLEFVPVHSLETPFFYLSRTRVSRAAYAEFAKELPNEAGSTWERTKLWDREPQSHDPVAGVSWEQADRFCRWLSTRQGRSYRLPTVDQWLAATASRATAWNTAVRLRGEEAAAFDWVKKNAATPSHANADYLQEWRVWRPAVPSGVGEISLAGWEWGRSQEDGQQPLLAAIPLTDNRAVFWQQSMERSATSSEAKWLPFPSHTEEPFTFRVVLSLEEP